MVPNERLANKLLGVFADLRLTPPDIGRVAFYMVQNAQPHDELVYRVKIFTDAFAYHESKYKEYEQYELF